MYASNMSILTAQVAIKVVYGGNKWFLPLSARKVPMLREFESKMAVRMQYSLVSHKSGTIVLFCLKMGPKTLRQRSQVVLSNILGDVCTVPRRCPIGAPSTYTTIWLHFPRCPTVHGAPSI